MKLDKTKVFKLQQYHRLGGSPNLLYKPMR